MNFCHWFIHIRCHGLGSVLDSPPQTHFEMLKPRKMGNKVQVLGVWGSPMGLPELANGPSFSSSKPWEKRYQSSLAILSTSFPIFQPWPNFKRLEMCQNHYIISSFEGKKFTKFPEIQIFAILQSFSSWFQETEDSVKWVKSVKCKHI